MSYQYGYLVGIAPLALVWLIFFILRSDLRKGINVMSILFGVGGLTSQLVYSEDWWHSSNITGTRIGFEDFLFGFFMGGVACFAYEVLFHKRLVPRSEPKSTFGFRYVGSMVVILFFGGYYFAGIDSFTATILAFLIPTIVQIYLRPDLMNNALFGALFSTLLGFLFVEVPEIVLPGWVSETWRHDELSGIMLLHLPMEDFFWFVLAGAFLAPIYKYWKNLVAIP
jgi:hypothetical protein